jgi:dipeptidyl-peptidase-4
MYLLVVLLFLVGFVAVGGTPMFAQNTSVNTVSAQSLSSQEKITLSGIYSGKYRAISTLPMVEWLSDGTALYYDLRQPPSKRVFERLDPKTGKRTPLFDAELVRANLKALRGSESVPMPVLNATGTFALLNFGDGIVLLNMKTGAVNNIIQGAKDDCTRFSPDGTKIAFVRKNDLYVYDIAKQETMRLTNDGSETTLNGTHSWIYWEEVYEREDRGYFWSPDSRSIAYYQSDESMVSQITFSTFKPAVPENIVQRYPKAGGTNPKVRLGIIDLPASSGQQMPTTWIELTGGADPQHEYLARVKWLPDSKRLAVTMMNRSQYDVALYVVDKASGKATKLLTETDSGWVNLHDDLYFLKDGKHFLWASERTGYNHLYRYTMDGKLVNAVTKGTWAVGEPRGSAIVAVDEAKGLVYFKALEKSSTERHLYSIKLDGTGMKRLTQEEGSHAIRMSDNAEYYTDRFSSLTTPPALRLHSADGKRLQEIAAPNTAEASKYQLSSPTLFAIPTPDGFQMPAQILKPRDFDPTKRYPVIIHVYGGPSTPMVANRWQSGGFDQVLADEGFLVVKMDNRTAAAISKKYENTCLKQLAGESELNDLVAGVRWLKKQSYVDSARLGIWGWSFGGCFTLLALTHTKEFRAGIAGAAPTDWRYYDTKYTEAVMKTPQENPDGYEKTNLNAQAKNLHGKLYLVHGTYDDNVHPQNAWNFIDELIRANKQFQLMMYPMRQHGVSDQSGQIHLYTSMVDFWKRELRGE